MTQNECFYKYDTNVYMVIFFDCFLRKMPLHKHNLENTLVIVSEKRKTFSVFQIVFGKVFCLLHLFIYYCKFDVNTLHINKNKMINITDYIAVTSVLNKQT